MPKRSRKQKNIRDLNVLAAHIVEQATGESIPKNISEESTKNPAAVALGRLGGLKGGKAGANGKPIALVVFTRNPLQIVRFFAGIAIAQPSRHS